MKNQLVKSQFFFKGTIMAEFTLNEKEFAQLVTELKQSEVKLSKKELDKIYSRLNSLELGYQKEESEKGYYEPVNMVQNMIDINTLLFNNRIKNDNMFGTLFSSF